MRTRKLYPHHVLKYIFWFFLYSYFSLTFMYKCIDIYIFCFGILRSEKKKLSSTVMLPGVRITAKNRYGKKGTQTSNE